MPRQATLWLDDIRKPPLGYDHWAKTANECIEFLRHEPVYHVSLDHDLDLEHYIIQEQSGYGPQPVWDRWSLKEKTGYAVLEWMKENAKWPPIIYVHSLSTGAADMMLFLQRYAPSNVQYQRVKPDWVRQQGAPKPRSI